MILQSKPLLKLSDFKYIKDIVRSSYIAGGKFVNELQKEFCKVQGTQYALATSSGTAALHLALLALNVGEGDQVIIPSYTCCALLHAVKYTRATPVLVDIDPETFNVTYSTIMSKITAKTKAIIVTHTFGFPAEIDTISKIGIPIIEDCAQSIGSQYKGGPIGTRGIISVFSMYATKMFTSGEGGMVCTNSKKIAEIVYDLNTSDMRESYRIRYNYKMSDLAAGIALSQLKKLNSFVKRRKSIAGRYKRSFASLSIKFQKILVHTIPNYYRFVIITSQAKKIIKSTNKQGVLCDNPVYKPLHHYFKNKDNDGFLGTDFVWERAVSVPIYPAMRNEELARVMHSVLDSFSGDKKGRYR